MAASRVVTEIVAVAVDAVERVEVVLVVAMV